MHPVGRYEAKVLECGMCNSSKGTPQVAVKFETEHGSIVGFFALTDKAAEYTIEKLRNMGWQGMDFEELNDPGAIDGNTCSITVAHESYEGKTNARVKFVNQTGYEGMELRREADAAKAATRFNVLLRKAKPQNAQAAQRDAAASAMPDPLTGQATPEADPDIPF